MTELSDFNQKSLFSTHRGGVSRLYTATFLPQDRLDNGLDSIEKKKAHLQRLEKEHCQAEIRAKILQLNGEKSRGFAFEETLTASRSLRPRLDKDALAFKKAKETKCPNVYTGQSQKHLDKYFRQVKSTFWSKPTIYAFEEDKCMYAGEYLGETPADD